MITLSNEKISVKIAKKGAELRSIVFSDTEYMWMGDPAIWSGTAPIMFPICGGLKEDKFLYDGKEYTLTKHGFAKMSVFEIEEQTTDSVVLLLKSSKETKKSYPFDFEFRVIFELEEQSVKVNYQVKNVGENTMYFNVGAHEAYATPEGIEDYDVVFDKEETLNAHNLFGNILAHTTYPIIKDTKVLPLYDKYFILDALPFTNVSSKAATLRNRKTGRFVRVEFPENSNLLLWHKHGAGYMCVEPWNGIPDMPGSSYEITDKVGISSLDPDEVYDFRHTITVGE